MIANYMHYCHENLAEIHEDSQKVKTHESAFKYTDLFSTKLQHVLSLVEFNRLILSSTIFSFVRVDV